MKTLVITILSLAPMAAMANNDLLCRDVKLGGDRGYIVNVKDFREAKITAESFGGPMPVEFGDLECNKPRLPGRPDREHTLSVCTTKENVADDGYTLTITGLSGGASAKATLERQSRRGPHQVAKLNCRRH